MITVNNGAKAAFTTHFTVFTPTPTPTPGGAPPTATTVSSTGGGSLQTAAGTERVTWTPGSFPSDSVELRVEAHSVNSVPVGDGLTLGTRTLSVGLFNSSGAAIHELTGSIEIVLDGAAENDVPAISADGKVWRVLSALPGRTLPAEWADGYWREQLTPTTYRIHIWVRHLTEFGLVKDTKAPSTPTGLAGTTTPDGVTLKWEPSTDNSGNVTSYVVAINGAAVKTVPASQTTTSVTFFPSNDARVFQVFALDAAGNMSPLSAGIAQVPALLGLSLSAATSTLTQQGFTVGKVVQDAPGEATTATVTAQAPAAPALAPLGTPVDLNVSVGAAMRSWWS